MSKIQINQNALLKILYIISGSAVLIGLIYVLWILIFARTPLFSWSQIQAYFLLTLEFLGILLIYDIRQRLTRKGKLRRIWPVLLIFLILNIIALTLLDQYYSHPGRADYDSVKTVLKIIPIAWLVLGFGTVFILVKVLQNQLSWLWDSEIFTDGINIGKKSRSATYLVLGSCFVVGMIIRLINLDGFPPYVDEYITTHFVYQLLNGAPFELERAFPTVGLPVLLSFKLFGINLWAARFPMVVLNMLAIVPLYFLGKKINRNIGFLSAAFYTINPWIIAVSRTVREYAVLPVFYFISAVFLLDLLVWENMTVKEYLKKNTWKVMVLSLILVNVVFDPQSIIKIVIINFGIFGVLLLLKLIKSKTPMLIKVTGLGVSLVVFILLVIVSSLSKRLFENGQIVLEAEGKYWQMLVSNTNQHWFSQLPQIAWLVLAVVAFFALRAVFKKYDEKDAVILYCFLVFLSILTFLTFFLVNPHLPARARYGILLEYWYIIPVAICTYLVFRLIKQVLGDKSNILFAVYLLVGISLINFSTIKYVLTYPGGGALKVTGEKHYVIDPAYRFMLTQLKPGDVLLNDSLAPYDELYQRKLGDVTLYSYIGTILRGGVTINELITRHPDGWIVLTTNSRLETNGLVFENSTIDGKALDYLGRWGECYIWHWKETGN